jgi:pimeloyl-ACP methyl ester carboxylesterase
MRIIVILITIILQACSPYKQVDNFAAENNFNKQFISTKPFSIASFHRISKNTTNNITVYLDGDGRSWIAGGSRITRDPTSSSTMLFSLAKNDQQDNVIYMARPCQHSKQDIIDKVCTNKYWAGSRYSDEIVSAVNQALDQIKQQYHNQSFELVGFSGGGAIVTLVAARRNDIKKIRTIAGNLDLQEMDRFHKTIPLYESLDPIQVAKQVAHIPQVHYVGSKDIVVPPIIARNFKDASGNPDNIVIVEIKDASHESGWENKVYN